MTSNPHPDETAPWARSLLRSTLGLWLSAVADPAGLFHPYLDRTWLPLEGGPLTLVSQCRLIYNFARGYETFQEGPYADAVRAGLDALRTHFRVSPGRYRWAVTGTGVEVDATPDAYGHAFCILAQATAARALGDASLAADAIETWLYLAATFTDAHGGLLWHLCGPQIPRSQNPVMHTFEALMALWSVDKSGQAQEAARGVLAFMETLPSFQAGSLIEEFTPDWGPLPVEQGGVVNLGHAFEWAWLLAEWHTMTGEVGALRLGTRFLHTGIEWGLDTDGGTREACTPDGKMIVAAKGLWPQCEAIRALHRYVTRHGRDDLKDALQRALAFYQRHFVDGEYGGLFASPEGLGSPTRLDKGDAWKLDYHSVGMCLELMGGDRE